MVKYKIEMSKQAIRDIERVESAGLTEKAKDLVAVLAENPYRNPPHYERLKGELMGAYSRRINKQHRLVYTVLEEQSIVRIMRM